MGSYGERAGRLTCSRVETSFAGDAVGRKIGTCTKLYFVVYTFWRGTSVSCGLYDDDDNDRRPQRVSQFDEFR